MHVYEMSYANIGGRRFAARKSISVKFRKTKSVRFDTVSVTGA